MTTLQSIKKLLVKALRESKGLHIEDADIVYPDDVVRGDLSLAVFRFAKMLQKSPEAIAADAAVTLQRKKIKYITKIHAVGGYINFFLDNEKIAKEILGVILKQKEKFGKAKTKKKEKILIEFVSPNSNKPLHLGHVRNAVLGEALSRTLEARGYKVIRANLVNDRGIHICKAMVAYEHFGRITQPDGRIVTDLPVVSGLKGDHFVGKYYVLYEKERIRNPKLEEEAQACLKLWEEKKVHIREHWRAMRAWVLDGFEETYRALGIHFDRTDYESDIWEKGKEIVLRGLQKKIFTRDPKGAVIAGLEKYDLPDKVLLRSDGTSIYITTDLYLALRRYAEEHFNKLLYVVGSEQDLYFKQLFAIFSLLRAPYANGAEHISYGMVFLPEGKMKSREGTVVDADDLIRKLTEYAGSEVRMRHDFLDKNEVDRRARIIALAALKFYMLAVNPPSTMHFNPKESLSFTGKTGPYLLYTLARMKSILSKSGKDERKGKRGEEFWKYLETREEKRLVISMAKFPEIIERSARTRDPEELATYLYNLAQAFSDFYEKCPVLREAPEIAHARLTLVRAGATALERGLYLLGIETLKEM